jgi:hypothetical protein
MDAQGKRMTYNGFSFESYSTKPLDPISSEATPRGPPGWSGDVDLNEEWCAVVKTALDGVRMVLGGEVDCLDGACPPHACRPLVSQRLTCFPCRLFRRLAHQRRRA